MPSLGPAASAEGGPPGTILPFVQEKFKGKGWAPVWGHPDTPELTEKTGLGFETLSMS